MNAEYWMTITVPVLKAIGELEEETPGSRDCLSIDAISDRSGVSPEDTKLLLKRLSVDESEWVSATWGLAYDPLDPCCIRGLGPRGLETVRGFPGRQAIVVALERLADETEDEEAQGALRRAAGLVGQASTQAIVAGAVDYARLRLLGQ